MKKLLLLLLLLSVVSCVSREPVTEQKLSMARELVYTQFSIDKLEPILHQTSDHMSVKLLERYGYLFNQDISRENKTKLVRYATRDLVENIVSVASIRESFIDYYAANISTKDITKLLKFFNTSLGRKFSSLIDVVLDESRVTEERKRSIFGNTYAKYNNKTKRTNREYVKYFYDNLTDSEKTKYINFSRSGIGGHYFVTLFKAMDSFSSDVQERFGDMDFEAALQRSINNVIAKYGEEYFGM